MEQDENKIYLTSKEFQKILTHEIGHGTDGVVFKYNKDYLIKLYRKDFFKKPEEILELPNDDSDIKIASKDNMPIFKTVKNNIQFYKKDEATKIRLPDEQAIEQTIAKQKKVIKTHLPQKLVYVDGKFVGVLLKTAHGIQVHKLTGMPIAFKKKVMTAVLDSVKELLENNIYHTDLDNSPYAPVQYDEGGEIIHSYGHSHILLDLNPFNMKVNIIDLDGKSTTYTDYYNKDLEEQSLKSLTKFMTEFFYGIDTYEHEYEDLEENDITTQNELEEHGLTPEEAEKYISNGLESIEQAQEFVNKAR